MSTIWKTTLDGVEYSGVYNRWGVVRLLPGKVPPDGYGTERGMVMRYPYYRIGYFIHELRKVGQPWEWCTDEEFFAEVTPGVAALDITAEELRTFGKHTFAALQTNADRVVDNLERIRKIADDLREIDKTLLWFRKEGFFK